MVPTRSNASKFLGESRADYERAILPPIFPLPRPASAFGTGEPLRDWNGFGFAAFSVGMKVGEIAKAAWWKGKLQEARTSTREPPPRPATLFRDRLVIDWSTIEDQAIIAQFDHLPRQPYHTLHQPLAVVR